MSKKILVSGHFVENVTSDALHYWSLDNIWDAKDRQGRTWGSTEGDGNSIVAGVHKSAYIIKTSSGKMTLLRASDMFYPCLVNPAQCSNGLTVSLWLKHWNIIGPSNSGQVFLRTGDGFQDETGFMLYQLNGTFDHLALQVNKPDTRFIYIFFAPEKVWSHYTFVWENEIKVYWNGERITEFIHQESKSHVSKEEPQLVLGDSGLNRHVSFDEITIWNKSLSELHIKNVFRFYNGAVYFSICFNAAIIYFYCCFESMCFMIKEYNLQYSVLYADNTYLKP